MSELTGTTYVRKDGAKEHNGPNWGDALAGTSKKGPHTRIKPLALANGHGRHTADTRTGAFARWEWEMAVGLPTCSRQFF